MEALFLHRLQFAFTITYHYLFPQISMGLALLIFILKTQALRGNPVANDAARFWAKILGVTFLMGVITGIPMEFQFGTNWSRFSKATGGIIGQTLAMEGVFAFFLESTFIYLFLFKEKKLSLKAHWVTSLLIFVGTWLSGWFIVCTNAFMQHPVGYSIAADGSIVLDSLSAYLTNPWALAQYSHTMIGATITGAFVMAGISAFYFLSNRESPVAKQSLKVAVIVGAVATVAAAFPTGDIQAKMVAKHQPVTFAAMEGHFDTERGASMTFIGQPNMETLSIDNAIELPKVLSFLTHNRWDSEIKGLKEFDREEWPDNVPLLYYSYHVMAGLGTIFIAIMLGAAFLLWRKKLFKSRKLLWVLMLAMPFPFIANTAGWMTAELGRQPWLVHGLMRTSQGSSDNVSAGNALFTLLGFMGMYALLSILFIIVMAKIILRGPEGRRIDG